MTFSVKPADFYNATYGETDSMLSVTIEKLTAAVEAELINLLAKAKEKKFHLRDTWFNASAALKGVTDELIGLATKVVIQKLIDTGYNAVQGTSGSVRDDDEITIHILFPRAKDQVE